MTQIGKIQFDFHMQNEDFARNLYGRWDSFFANNVERVLNEEVGTRNEEVLVVERLELDLGNILEEEFEEQFPVRFREKLEEALAQCFYDFDAKQTHNKKSSPLLPASSFKNDSSLLLPTSSFHLFCRFLLHGTLPWSATDEDKDINRLFLKVLHGNPKELKQFLQTYGHDTSLRERIVYQLQEPSLEKGVALLELGAGDFIVGYVKFLQERYEDTAPYEITQSDYRNAVWIVGYAYLLTHRSSYFDKKSFVTQTMSQLAGRYNLHYETLLQLMTLELERFAKKQIIPQELLLILSQLREESTEKRRRNSSIDAEKFHKTTHHPQDNRIKIFPADFAEKRSEGNKPHSDFIFPERVAAGNFYFCENLRNLRETVDKREMLPSNYFFMRLPRYHSLQKAPGKNIATSNREALFSVLSKAGSCRAFLQYLKEDEIIALIKIIVPAESQFVIKIAHLLDIQKRQGRLQGKAGGEFRLLKWQIIFPLLLENRGASFNRKYFVQQLFSKVAARYNVTVLALLDFFNREPQIATRDKELKEIFRLLTEEYQEKQSKSEKETDRNLPPLETERQNKNAHNVDIEKENNQKLKFKEMEEMTNNQTEAIFVNNAGMVLLYPFIQRLFAMLELTENNTFKNKEAQTKAVYLLQYAVFGKTDFPEHELVLNKILIGLAISEAIPLYVELSQNEQEIVTSMQKGVLQNWEKLKNTSIEGLQQSFLQREGKLEEKEDGYTLTVEDKAYDILLDSVPWNFRMIKLPWMEKRMEVKWR